jgi:hypothetical protein
VLLFETFQVVEWNQGEWLYAQASRPRNVSFAKPLRFEQVSSLFTSNVSLSVTRRAARGLLLLPLFSTNPSSTIFLGGSNCRTYLEIGDLDMHVGNWKLLELPEGVCIAANETWPFRFSFTVFWSMTRTTSSYSSFLMTVECFHE